MSTAAPAARTGPSPGRLLGLAAAVLVLAALVFWAASRVTWVSAEWATPLRGRVAAGATGEDTEPVLVPWALLSLAAVAGILATSGWGRRVVGVVVALAGIAALVRAATGFATPAPDALPAPARQAGTLLTASAGVVGPLLALLAGLLLAAVGVLVVLAAPVLPRLGARYDAPGAPRRARDPDRELWEALDEGHDPTTDAPAPTTSSPAPPVTRGTSREGHEG